MQPSNYSRRVLEAAVRRRLEIAKILRDDPTTTNIMLAKALKVSRNTISQDRKLMIEDLKNATLSETEQLRQAMVDKLEGLNKELALHRKDGKLPVGVIHEMMLVNRSIIELLGIRKAVVEKLEVKKSTISFRTVIASTQKELTESKGKTFAMTTGHLALKAGEDV